jgi:protein-L-isoaspartate(D-aspartate) O-methyltransferase
MAIRLRHRIEAKMKRLIISNALLLCLLTSPLLFGQGQEPPRFKEARLQMVEKTIQNRGISDPKVLEAMRTVPRHLFVPKGSVGSAYADRPLRIGEGQTISQPYIVALMTEILGLDGDETVLEIGTGSGYQAAVLSEIAAQVYTIEIKKLLHESATRLLRERGYRNVKTRFGDGYFGWKEAAPFDAIMITAAVDHIPPPLLAQLKDGGKLVLPLGSPYSYMGQILVLVTKTGEDYRLREILAVRFVPMTGKALEKSN